MYELESSFSGNGFIPSTKRPFYDGVNDYSTSSFTVYDWLGVPDGTTYQLTEGVLFDFTYKCNLTPASWYDMGGISPRSSSFTGFLWWIRTTAFIFDLYSEIFIEPVITSGITWLDGVERRITIHIRFDGGLMYVKIYVNGVIAYSASNASTYIYFLGVTGTKMCLSKWNANDSTFRNYAQFYKQFDLFQTGNYSDAQVASYLADRDALNAHLYARFLFNEGSGATSYADNDVTKEMNHINITEPDFWQEY